MLQPRNVERPPCAQSEKTIEPEVIQIENLQRTSLRFLLSERALGVAVLLTSINTCSSSPVWRFQ